MPVGHARAGQPIAGEAGSLRCSRDNEGTDLPPWGRAWSAEAFAGCPGMTGLRPHFADCSRRREAHGPGRNTGFALSGRGGIPATASIPLPRAVAQPSCPLSAGLLARMPSSYLPRRALSQPHQSLRMPLGPGGRRRTGRRAGQLKVPPPPPRLRAGAECSSWPMDEHALPWAPGELSDRVGS